MECLFSDNLSLSFVLLFLFHHFEILQNFLDKPVGTANLGWQAGLIVLIDSVRTIRNTIRLSKRFWNSTFWKPFFIILEQWIINVYDKQSCAKRICFHLFWMMLIGLAQETKSCRIPRGIPILSWASLMLMLLCWQLSFTSQECLLPKLDCKQVSFLKIATLLGDIKVFLSSYFIKSNTYILLHPLRNSL